MEKPDFISLARGSFYSYEPGNDESFFLDRLDKAQQQSPGLTEKEFIQQEMKYTTRLLASGEIDIEYDRMIRQYRVFLRERPRAFIREYRDQLRKEQKPRLSINQIALIHVYKGRGSLITRQNANEIARAHGHNSGEKLFQRFTYYSSRANRAGIPKGCTLKILQNKIALFESVLNLLPPERQSEAKDEISILKSFRISFL